MEALGRRRVEGGVSPAIEVDPGENAGLARNSRVDLVVGKNHRVHLQPVVVKVLFKIIEKITCMLSMSSPLSQKIVDNFTFLISFSCNLGHHGFIHNISLALQPAQL